MKLNRAVLAMLVVVGLAAFSTSAVASQLAPAGIEHFTSGVVALMDAISVPAAIIALVFALIGFASGNVMSGVWALGASLFFFLTPTLVGSMFAMEPDKVVTTEAAMATANTSGGGDHPVILAFIMLATIAAVAIVLGRWISHDTDFSGSGLPPIGELSQAQTDNQSISPPIEQLRTDAPPAVASEVIVEKNKRRIVL